MPEMNERTNYFACVFLKAFHRFHSDENSALKLQAWMTEKWNKMCKLTVCERKLEKNMYQ